MFEGWENFYLIVGPSAGALIGLMFVVVTLTAGRDREQTERGKHLYTSPIVWHLAVVLVLSGAAVAPTIHPELFGIVSAGLALLGVAMGVRSAVGIRRAQMYRRRQHVRHVVVRRSSRAWSMSGWAAPRSRSSAGSSLERERGGGGADGAAAGQHPRRMGPGDLPRADGAPRQPASKR